MNKKTAVLINSRCMERLADGASIDKAKSRRVKKWWNMLSAKQKAKERIKLKNVAAIKA